MKRQFLIIAFIFYSFGQLSAQSTFKVVSIDKQVKVIRTTDNQIKDSIAYKGMLLASNDKLIFKEKCKMEFKDENSPNILTYYSRTNEIKSFAQIYAKANSNSVSIWSVVISTLGGIIGKGDKITEQTEYVDPAVASRSSNLLSSSYVASIFNTYVISKISNDSFVSDTTIALRTIADSCDLCHFEIINKTGEVLYINILAIDKSTKKVSVCLGLVYDNCPNDKIRVFLLPGRSIMDLSAFPFIMNEEYTYIAVASRFPYSSIDVNMELEKGNDDYNPTLKMEGFYFAR